MSKIDWSKYGTVEQIERDIRSVAIQGATNVAIATFQGIKLFLKLYNGVADREEFIKQVKMVGEGLANARPNEPLAKNGVKYVFYHLTIRYPNVSKVDEIINAIDTLADEFLEIIKVAKDKIVVNSASVMTEVDEILTHCHSSTAERVIAGQNERRDGKLKVVCTETRPLFQGRITAKNLLDAGVDTTMIADSAVESFIIGRGSFGIDVILVGADEITMDGHAVNKIGSWGVALASYYASKPIYVVSSILKTDVSTMEDMPKIEMRAAKEIWPDAPADLKLVNPSFDLIDNKLITGFITEVGVIKPEEISATIKGRYEWLF